VVLESVKSVKSNDIRSQDSSTLELLAQLYASLVFDDLGSSKLQKSHNYRNYAAGVANLPWSVRYE